MILYSHPLYERLAPWLGAFERKRPYRELAVATERHDLRYGYCTASEFLESLPLRDTRWVVSTLPDMASNRDLLHGLRELHYAGEVAIVAREEFDGIALTKLGVSTILYPMRNAVDYAVQTLTAIIRQKGDAR